MFARYFLLCLAMLATALAKSPWYPDIQYVNIACLTAINSGAQFCSTKPKSAKSYNPCICSTEVGLASLIRCHYNHTSEYSEVADKYLRKSCKALKVNLTKSDIHEVYAKYPLSDFVNVASNKSFNGSKDIITSPILTPLKKYTHVYLSNRVRSENSYRGYLYGIGLCGYWAGVLLIAGVYHWVRLLVPQTVFGFRSKWINFVRKHVTLAPALPNNKVLVPLSFRKWALGLIPTRLDSLVVAGYAILHLVFLTIKYHHVEGNTLFPTLQNEISRYIGDRSGMILNFTTPLVILFAGKNNFLTYLTGIKQSDFYTYHKWCARLLAITVTVHAGAFTAQSVAAGKLHKRLNADYYRWGIVGFAMALGLCVHSMYLIRQRCYEVFLLVHLLLAFFYLFGAWRHAASQEYEQWYYAATAVWAFDRFFSACRVFAFGFPVARVRLVANETLKVTVKKPAYWKSYAGSYGYVYFFTSSTFWQSHPFTILDTKNDRSEISFCIKVKNGATKKIAAELLSKPNYEGEFRVSVEGPYGTPVPMKKYNKSVFVASGNGIPGPFYYALDLAKHSTNKDIVLYWTVRYYETLEWMHQELLELHALGSCRVKIFVTRPNASKEEVLNNHEHYAESSEKEKESANGASEKDSADKDSSEKSLSATESKSALTFNVAELKKQLHLFEFHENRPDMDALVKSEMETAKESIAFMSCGHASMVDHLRMSILNNMNSSDVRVDFYSENQQW